VLGRFLSQDTYPVNVNNPVELNRYVYTANNPVNAIDPSGYTLAETGSLQIFPTIGRTALTPLAFYVGAVAVGIAFGLLMGQVVEAPPRENFIEKIYKNVKESNTGSGYEPGGGNYAEIIGAVVALVSASLLAYNTVQQATDTDEEARTKPIVLDLGPSLEINGEIMPLIAYYKPQGIKVVAIEQEIVPLAGLKFLEASMPDDFAVIQGSFTDSTVLSSHGYNCANAAFSLWPGFNYGGNQGFAGVPIAISNLVCSGGYVHVITEVPSRFEYIAGASAGFVNWQFKSPVSKPCVNNPFSQGCSGYSAFSIPVGFNSEHIRTTNFALIGQKN